jgi:hypothetical protein
MVVGFYLVIFRLREMRGYLKSCSAVTDSEGYLSFGFKGRFTVLGRIVSVVAYPDFYLRKGMAHAEDLKDFPVGLKRVLFIYRWSLWTMILLGIFVHGLTELYLLRMRR